jgi:hypothetical protein
LKNFLPALLTPALLSTPVFCAMAGALGEEMSRAPRLVAQPSSGTRKESQGIGVVRGFLSVSDGIAMKWFSIIEHYFDLLARFSGKTRQ